MDTVIIGALASGTIYTGTVIVLCTLIVRSWWMILFLVLNVLVFGIFSIAYIKKSFVMGWVGETFDMCYILCQVNRIFGKNN